MKEEDLHKICVAIWKDYSEKKITYEEFEEQMKKLKGENDKKVINILDKFEGRLL